MVGQRHATSSAQPFSMKYQCFSIELEARRSQWVASQEVVNQHVRGGSWWPGAHTSAPKAASTYAAESRSGLSQGTRAGGRNCTVQARYRWKLRRQMNEEQKRESPCKSSR